METSLAVVHDGTVASLTGVTGPVPWWSFTKTIIAAGALALVRDGRLSLDETLPKRRYTLRHLLAHRAGVANYGDLTDYHEAVERGDDPWPASVLLERAEADRLRFEPGADWSYSNIGYLFVRQLIEAACSQPLGEALAQLVLRPLGIEGPRMALLPGDLAGVFMGDAHAYHPGWVYHGLMVGRLDQAALLLSRLLTAHLLPSGLIDQMLTGPVLDVPLAGRPWMKAIYGLGVMTGTSTQGSYIAGHTGSGPGSTIAVYHSRDGARPVTAAAFSAAEDQAIVETAAFDALGPG